MTLFSWLFGDKSKANDSGHRTSVANRSNCVEAESTMNDDKYFSLLSQIQDWQVKKQYEKMLHCCEKSIPLLEGFVSETKREYGSFDISSIPAIEVGCRYWAALGCRDKLEAVKKAISLSKELKDGWLEFVDASFEDANLSERIQRHLASNPGFPQNRFGKALNVSGRDTSRLVSTLSNLGIVKRTQVGKTYALHLVAREP